jgi:hypothetical protein
VKKVVLIGLVVAVVIYAVWAVIQNSGNNEARHAARDAIIQLKAALGKDNNSDEVHTLSDAVQAQYDRNPGAFSDCRRTFEDMHDRAGVLLSYWWSSTYRRNGFQYLNEDCDALLAQLK